MRASFHLRAGRFHWGAPPAASSWQERALMAEARVRALEESLSEALNVPPVMARQNYPAGIQWGPNP